MQSNKNASAEMAKMKLCDIDQTLAILIEAGLERWGYKDLVSELQRQDSFAIVGKIKNKVIGFCVARLIMTNNITAISTEDFSNPQSNFSGQHNSMISREFRPECEIYNIAVKKGFQNCGIGSRLLKQLIILSKAHKVGSIWLEVRESNTGAINFYQKNNFVLMYVRKNFYSNPHESAIVMKRDLLPNSVAI